MAAKIKALLPFGFSVTAALALIIAAAAARPPVAAQAPPTSPLSDMVLDCSMHARGGPWVAKEIRADGVLRFNGLSAFPVHDSGATSQENVYIAFWTHSKGDGELLYLTLRTFGPRRWLTLMDEARLFYAKGRMNLGTWQRNGTPELHSPNQRELLLKMLDSAALQTIPVREVPHTRTVCDSLLPPQPR